MFHFPSVALSVCVMSDTVTLPDCDPVRLPHYLSIAKTSHVSENTVAFSI